MTDNPIPRPALDSHIAILGKTGSGKSNFAKIVAEDLMQRGERVCVLDPTGTWWGMRLLADGETPSDYPMAIFGGRHADVPIGPDHGEVIARTVGTSQTPAIVDTRLMSVSDRTKFFIGFAETLISANEGIVTIIIDEAHVFMPQTGASGGGRAPAMLHAGNNLVSLGRGVGIRIVLITQRPAKLHKDSLTQVETLVAMRLLGPQDRKAVKDWIGECADPDSGANLLNSLPKLQTGEAWVWSPEIDHLKKTTCPLVTTYDSGFVREQSVRELPPIDTAALAELLEKDGYRPKEDDPKTLRKTIARLEKELEAARVPGRERYMVDEAQHILQQDIPEALRTWLAAIGKLQVVLEVRAPDDDDVPPLTAPAPAPAPAATPAPEPEPPQSQHERSGTRALSSPQQRVLDALAWLTQSAVAVPCNRVQLAFAAEYTPGTGTFNNICGQLRTLGMVQYPQPGTMALTPEGLKHAYPPTDLLTSENLHARVLGRLVGPQRKLFEVLLRWHPHPMLAEELAEQSGYTPGTGTFNNIRGRLRTMGVISYPERGYVALRDIMFVQEQKR